MGVYDPEPEDFAIVDSISDELNIAKTEVAELLQTDFKKTIIYKRHKLYHEMQDMRCNIKDILGNKFFLYKIMESIIKIFNK